MFKLIISQTRPSVDVEFFYWGIYTREHIKNNYVNTGKIIGPVENSSSPDMLTRVTTINFASIEDAYEFRDDPALAEERLEKQEYDVANGIVTSDNVFRD